MNYKLNIPENDNIKYLVYLETQKELNLIINLVMLKFMMDQEEEIYSHHLTKNHNKLEQYVQMLIGIKDFVTNVIMKLNQLQNHMNVNQEVIHGNQLLSLVMKIGQN